MPRACPGDILVPFSYCSRTGTFDTVILPPLPGDNIHWKVRYDDPEFPNAFSLWVLNNS